MELKSTVGVGTKLEIVFIFDRSPGKRSREKGTDDLLKQVIDRLKLDPLLRPGMDHRCGRVCDRPPELRHEGRQGG